MKWIMLYLAIRLFTTIRIEGVKMTVTGVLLYFGLAVVVSVLSYWFLINYVYNWSEQERKIIIRRIEKTLVTTSLICIILPVLYFVSLFMIHAFCMLFF